LSKNTGEDAGNVGTTGISMDKFLVFVMNAMAVFVPLLNKVINSGSGVKTRYELTLQSHKLTTTLLKRLSRGR